MPTTDLFTFPTADPLLILGGISIAALGLMFGVLRTTARRIINGDLVPRTIFEDVRRERDRALDAGQDAVRATRETAASLEKLTAAIAQLTDPGNSRPNAAPTHTLEGG